MLLTMRIRILFQSIKTLKNTKLKLLNQNKNFLCTHTKFRKRYINAFLVKTKKENACNTVNRPIAIIAA